MSAFEVPVNITGGTSALAKIKLTGPSVPASCGNFVFALQSNAPSVQVPGQVKVPGETSEVAFLITTSPVAVSQTATITIYRMIFNATINAHSFSSEAAVPKTLTVTP